MKRRAEILSVTAIEKVVALAARRAVDKYDVAKAFDIQPDQAARVLNRLRKNRQLYIAIRSISAFGAGSTPHMYRAY